MNVLEFQNALEAVSPALAKKGPLPLQCVYLDGKRIMAFDDQIMMGMDLEQEDLLGGYQGKILQAWLKGDKGETLTAKEVKVGEKLSIGRATITLVPEDMDTFVFDSTPKESADLMAFEDFMSSLEFVETSMSDGANEVWKLGVTINPAKDEEPTQLYATNGMTLCSAAMPAYNQLLCSAAMVPTIISPRFIEQLLRHAATREVTRLYFSQDGSSTTAEFEGGLTLWGRNITGVEIDRYLSVLESFEELSAEYPPAPKPDDLQSTLKTLVGTLKLGGDLRLELRVLDGVLRLKGVAGGCKLVEFIDWPEHPDVEITVLGEAFYRMSESALLIGLYERGASFSGESSLQRGMLAAYL